MATGDPEGQMFLSHPHTNTGLFFLLTNQIPHFILGKKHEKDFQKILKSLRCALVTKFNITMTSRIDMRPACGRRAANVRLFVLLSFPRACTGMWDRMGKNSENVDLVCENIAFLIYFHFILGQLTILLEIINDLNFKSSGFWKFWSFTHG